MPTTDQLRSKLINKLKELFQLNQPDLDFGFYRIMHAKSEQVSSFIENDLLHVIQDTFGQADETKKDKLKQELDNAIQTAIDFGAPDPEVTPKVIEARARYEAIKDNASSEAEIYDHLYRFFERYYDDGDFISRRYYTRETPGKAAPFSIPYNGEEVKLHWANADQYYIKTTEYFANYTVNLTEAIKGLKESKKRNDEEIDLDDGSVPEGLKLHFRIIDATEGEHANVKASDATKRYFLIHKANPVKLNDKKELIINFEYRPDQAGAKQDALNKDALTSIINALKKEPAMAAYYEYLSTSIPTDKDKDRILLTKYINQYTARNTMDYFIHKNLGAFLKRELDFYIKNEIMRLDDIENAEAPKVEDYLSKIKVLRKIAIKLIEFMAQLEDFQKKLWLKKKFVVETNYCITLDRVPEALYPQIIANKEQIEEWIKLYAINEIEGDATSPAYTNPLTLNFLKVNDKLMLDTRFFDDIFKAKLLSSIQNFDDQCDGLLIHSENFQALNLLQERYREQLDCTYIDPPYNSDASAIAYKNDYKDSSWLALLENRFEYSSSLIKKDGIICAAIDDEEVCEMRLLMSHLFAKQVGIVAVRSNPAGRKTKGKFAPAHEYAIFFGNSDSSTPSGLEKTEKSLGRYPQIDEKGRFAWANFIRSGNNDKREDRPKLYYPIFVDNNDNIRIPRLEWSESIRDYILLEQPNDNEAVIYPIQTRGDMIIEKNWQRGHVRANQELEEFRIRRSTDGKISIDFKTRMDEESLPITWWDNKEYASANYGAAELKELFLDKGFDFPKAIQLVSNCLRAMGMIDSTSSVLDYFGGSGTTGHAVINLNREDKEIGKRKYILIEMGDYFDSVLKPRISKAIYSDDWKDGKPKNRYTGISHCFKYLRLESYEDTLNNLVLQSEPIRDKTIAGNASLKEDYLLHYMLDVESKGSQSLLNIDAFNDPTSYVLKVKKPGSDEYIEKAVDLIETFTYLIGLRLVHLGIPQSFTAAFTRLPDPDLPQNQDTKLIINGDFKQIADGKWWIRKVEGWVPKNPYSPNDGLREKVLIVWRKLTGNLEEDNLILDSWFTKNRISTLDWEFDTIYVNGSNNLPNLQQDGDTWKVRLIDEEFMKRMWEQN
jgi:adenine-specific DNA-methyltransferase